MAVRVALERDSALSTDQEQKLISAMMEELNVEYGLNLATLVPISPAPVALLLFTAKARQ